MRTIISVVKMTLMESTVAVSKCSGQIPEFWPQVFWNISFSTEMYVELLWGAAGVG